MSSKGANVGYVRISTVDWLNLSLGRPADIPRTFNSPPDEFYARRRERVLTNNNCGVIIFI
jgi:hypothetical protein